MGINGNVCTDDEDISNQLEMPHVEPDKEHAGTDGERRVRKGVSYADTLHNTRRP